MQAIVAVHAARRVIAAFNACMQTDHERQRQPRVVHLQRRHARLPGLSPRLRAGQLLLQHLELVT